VVEEEVQVLVETQEQVEQVVQAVEEMVLELEMEQQEQLTQAVEEEVQEVLLLLVLEEKELLY
jgi:hypothetical protein